MADNDVKGTYQVSDALWEKIKPLLPPEPSRTRGGRPRMESRKVMEAILYVLHTGCKWKELPGSLGSPSTVRSRFQEWRNAGLFHRMWGAGLLTYDELRTLFWHGRRHLQP